MSIRILQGDCLEVMKTLESKSCDLLVCDLPYGVLTNCAKWDIKIDLEHFWKEAERLLKNDNSPVLMFCSTRFGYELIKSKEKWFRYDIVWEKLNAVGFLHANRMPLRSHEMIYVFAKKGAYYKRIDITGDFKYNGGGRSADKCYGGSYKAVINDNTGKRCVRSVIKIGQAKIKGGHPTQKPNELYKWILERYCPLGGTILDPTAGSFTSCFVAKELGLNAIGIEKNKAFYDKAIATNI
jgi:DNA modification methylase